LLSCFLYIKLSKKLRQRDRQIILIAKLYIFTGTTVITITASDADMSSEFNVFSFKVDGNKTFLQSLARFILFNMIEIHDINNQEKYK
jgi:hypothetical protein